MTTMPVLGLTELAPGQAVPETTVNELGRHLEQGARWFGRVKDRDLATPPGSPADGDCYLVAASGTGAWSGHDGEIAFYMSTAWEFIEPLEGDGAYFADEDVAAIFDGGAWNALAVAGSGAATTQAGEGIAIGIGSPADGDYIVGLKMPHAGTITETTTKSASGTCTATFKINTTALGGTANSVSSSEQSQAHASSNAFSAGDDIVLTVSSNSSCTKLAAMVKYTRTLD